MEEVKVRKKRGSFLLKVAIFVFAVFLVVMLVVQGTSIGAKRAELAALEKEIEEQRLVNDGLRYELENEAAGSDEYAERIARRELGYVYPGERVFYNVGGNN